MRLWVWLAAFVVLLGTFSRAETSSALKQEKSPPDSRVIDSLPPPNDKEISKIRSADEWHNPYIIVAPDGYELIPSDKRRNQENINLEQLEQRLLKLPRDQWPLGKVVVVQEIGLRNPGDQPAITANLEAVLRMLNHHKLRIDRWPSG